MLPYEVVLMIKYWRFTAHLIRVRSDCETVSLFNQLHRVIYPFASSEILCKTLLKPHCNLSLLTTHPNQATHAAESDANGVFYRRLLLGDLYCWGTAAKM